MDFMLIYWLYLITYFSLLLVITYPGYKKWDEIVKECNDDFFKIITHKEILKMYIGYLVWIIIGILNF